MDSMIKRWLRGRLGISEHDDVDDSDDEPVTYGALVRKGRHIALRTHVEANREAFQRWYADEEIASLLRHDLEPLSDWQSRGYFDSFVLPLSAKGMCFAIHERKTKRLLGTTALTDKMKTPNGDSALFRIVIGEKDAWGRGYGTEATRLVLEEAFEVLGFSEVRLEVFGHNERALKAYERVGFQVTGEHTEWVPRRHVNLRVIEMQIAADAFARHNVHMRAGHRGPASYLGRGQREERKAARAAKRERRAEKKARRLPTLNAPKALETPESASGGSATN
jgi:RimJ/RimL family protein N-acetyltransferase